MSAIFWGIYRGFNDPPGTPKDKKCVACKVAAGSLTLSAAGICMYKLKKHLKPRLALAMVYGFAGFCLLSASAVTFRVASDHYKYNQQLEANYKEQLRRQRINTKVNSNSSIEHVS